MVVSNLIVRVEWGDYIEEVGELGNGWVVWWVGGVVVELELRYICEVNVRVALAIIRCGINT